jgi:hypothetical protein
MGIPCLEKAKCRVRMAVGKDGRREQMKVKPTLLATSVL